MPCFFCIAAITIAASFIVPAVVDRTEETMRTAAADLRRIKETSTVVMWTGTFRFTTATGAQRMAATNVTVYKDSRRARIQCLSHDLSHDEVHALQDSVASLIQASVVSRTDGDAKLLTTRSHGSGPLNAGVQVQADAANGMEVQRPQER